MEKIVRTDAEWKKTLSQLEFNVCRKHGTERAFSGKYDTCKDDGIYACKCCGAELFLSTKKFDSGTGWPSFYAPITEEAVTENVDNSFFMERTEVICSRCDSHLGHVFTDGPQPTGLRYCLNSVSLNLIKK